MKRAVSDRSLRIESVSQLMNMVYTVSLDPDPMPLDVKIVLLGNRRLYHLLREHDTDFDGLFKIVADFDEHVPWDEAHQAAYGQLLARLVRSSGLRHLSAGAVASVLEQSSRLVEDRRRLSARVTEVEDILREADQLAADAGRAVIEGADVDRVIGSGLIEWTGSVS